MQKNVYCTLWGRVTRIGFTSRHPAAPGNALLVGLRRRECLGYFQIGFGVGEFVELLDLQASIIVGNDVNDVDRLADGVYPVWVLCSVSDLSESMR